MSVSLPLPLDMCKTSSGFTLVGGDRPDLYEFDLNFEVKELIKRYQKRVNMNYHHSEIEDLKLKEVDGQINKYIFTQTDIDRHYKIKLKNLRRALEGVKFFGSHNMVQYEGKSQASSDRQLPMINFFSGMDIEIVREIDEFNKIIKYTPNRKDSQDFQDGIAPE